LIPLGSTDHQYIAMHAYNLTIAIPGLIKSIQVNASLNYFL
jgi:hypothetical protein